jgi:hypothetical protein
MVLNPDPFGAKGISAFVQHVAPLLSEFGYPPRDVEAQVSFLRTALSTERAHGLESVASWAQNNGIRRCWNEVLSTRRAPFLARLIAPHVTGSLLDLLCGDGAVGKELERLLGAPVRLVERARNRGTEVRPWASEILDLEEFDAHLPRERYDTVLLCAVLHHESDPVELLQLAMRYARRRVVVVENCIDEEFPAEYQQLIDRFFNESLNKTSLLSPAQHRPRSEWLKIFARHGTASMRGSVRSAPGVPLLHDLMVIDCAGAA